MLSSLQAGAVALLTAGVGFAVALGVFDPGVAQAVVGFGTAVVAFGFLLANSIIHHGVTTGGTAGVQAAKSYRIFG